MTHALRTHWREYLIEAFGLGAFMVSACLFCALLELPGSPVRAALPNGDLRRVLMGLAMGATAAAIIYSPWGRRSGAHINPSVTLTFLRLGKVKPWDAAFYVAAQFAGAAAGVALSAALLGTAIAHPSVDYVVTLPGHAGVVGAFLAELVISAVLMLTVLSCASNPRLEKYTGLFAATLVALYISLEAPLSGMSMNPARTFGSALLAGEWRDIWLYFVAPPLGMFLGAEVHHAWGHGGDPCARLTTHDSKPCITCGTECGRKAAA